MCLSKARGGLGIRSTTSINEAMIGKLSWRILIEENGLWADILRAKYMVGSGHRPSYSRSSSMYSAIWRSIRRGLEKTIPLGAGWNIGKGKTVYF